MMLMRKSTHHKLTTALRVQKESAEGWLKRERTRTIQLTKEKFDLLDELRLVMEANEKLGAEVVESRRLLGNCSPQMWKQRAEEAETQADRWLAQAYKNGRPTVPPSNV